MNVLVRTVAVLGCWVVSGGILGGSRILSVPAEATIFPQATLGVRSNQGYPSNLPISSLPLIDAPRILSQVGDNLDLALLAKASAAFFQSERYRTESEIQVKATSGSTSLTSTARATTIVQSPNKFRAEIVFPDSKDPKQPDSIVISDGKQVWISRPGLKQYMVTPYKQFGQVEDNYWIGMSSLWFLEVSPATRETIAQGALADPEVQKDLGLSDETAIQGTTETINGQALYVYEYKDKQGFTIRAFVDPKTATLQQIILSGQSDGYDVLISERILRRVADPTITTLTFQPPPRTGAKQVKTLAIGPL
jgi:outer membrane lipoprotein-sorting protein